MTDSASRDGDFAYDVALSFAGEQRSYVQKVAAALRRQGIRPFYDDYEKVELWGKDLYEHLDWVYQKAARYCVLFASESYEQKIWATHERRSAQARALGSHQEYVLPVRFDDTEIPGIRGTVQYQDARRVTPGQLAKLIGKKLGPRWRSKFFPPEPDRLFTALGIGASDDFVEEEKQAAYEVATSFMQMLIRMTREERRLLAHIFQEGCPSQMPDNMHISLDILRRDLRIAPTGIVERLRGMSSLGIEQEVRPNSDRNGDDVVVVRWLDLMHCNSEAVEAFSIERSTEVAMRMLTVGIIDDDCCLECSRSRLDHLDFSLLSSVATDH